MVSPIKIYVAIEEGAGICHAPVNCIARSDGTFKILPEDGPVDIFDYEDNSELFEFGPGDIVKARSATFPDRDASCLVAHLLIKSGSEKNDFKRLCFDILEHDPEPNAAISRHGKSAIRRLLTEKHRGNYLYPAIRDWIDRHQGIVEKVL